MSKRSAHSVKNRVKAGTQSNRRIDAHILEARTVRLAQLVSKSLKPIIRQEVRDEFDRRTFTTEETDRTPSSEGPVDRSVPEQRDECTEVPAVEEQSVQEDQEAAR